MQAVEADEQDGNPVRAVYRSLSGVELNDGPWQAALYDALSRNEVVFRINEELGSPRALRDIPPALEKAIGRPVSEAEILAWLTLGAASRKDSRPLFRPVVHAFVRGISGAVVSFPSGEDAPRLWLAAEQMGDDGGETRPHLPVTTCTTCGQHYFIAHLKDYHFTGRAPSGGEVGADGTYWEVLPDNQGGKRVVLVDHLLGESDDEDAPPHALRPPISAVIVVRRIRMTCLDAATAARPPRQSGFGP